MVPSGLTRSSMVMGDRDALLESFEQEAQTRHARLVEQRQVWEAEHPGGRERHQAATDAYHAQERHHAAEQTHDALIAHDLVAASFPDPGARRWPQRPDDPPKPELHRPARGIERRPYRGREGPSLGL